MNCKHKILVYGYFGYRSNRLDGQNAKTRDLYRLLEQQVGSEQLDYFDTEDIRHNPFSQLILFCKVWQCRQLVYLPAENNLRAHLLILYAMSRIRHFDILYIVIGGWLVETLRRHHTLVKPLKKIRGIFTETQQMKQQLEQIFRFSNVQTFPNFRLKTDFTPSVSPMHQPLQLVFMARITKPKGLDWIFALGEYIVQHNYAEQVSIDFYGFIFEEDEEYFQANLSRFPFMHYCGMLPTQDIPATLNCYDALLLPTHYYTEGFPGSILDAYSAGLPVIVTRWKHADEFVDDTKTGYILPFEDGIETLCQRVESLILHPEQLNELKQNALDKSQLYSADKAWSILQPYI
ncbi:MAG: glycosyltransferase family 4 protein [Paludibacteraceae bacterium]|nr:glycosyltransferase family 4 protein [Paludibacteraceae bacterium]